MTSCAIGARSRGSVGRNGISVIIIIIIKIMTIIIIIMITHYRDVLPLLSNLYLSRCGCISFEKACFD